MPKFAFRVTDQDEARLRKIANERGISLSDLGRLAIEAFIDEKLIQNNRSGPRADPVKPHSRHRGKSAEEANARLPSGVKPQGPRVSIVERILARTRNKPLGPFR